MNFQDSMSPGLVDLTTDELDLNGYDGSSIYNQGTFAKQQTPDVLFGQLQPQQENNNGVPHQLIGRTSERNALSGEIDRAFTESLNSDIRKEMELRYTDSVNTKAVDLQNNRIARVVPEPGLTDPHVYIAVRHPTLGTRRRRFCQDNTFNCVYDWVGSLALHPMYFNLYCIKNNTIIKTWELVCNFQNTAINVSKFEIGFLRQRKMKNCIKKNKTKKSMKNVNVI